jgi:hypothetical protein
VGVNAGNILHFCLPLVLCLIGFHGVFFYANLWRKAAGWCFFQLGLTAFLWQLEPSGVPLPTVLIILILACTVGVGILLGVFCLKLGRRYKTLDGGDIANRGSK